MKIKLETIVMVETVNQLKVLSQKDLKASLAYDIALICNEIDKHLKVYVKIKNELFKKYGEKQEKETYKIKDENLEIFTKEHDDILKKDIDLNIKKIDIEELKKQDTNIKAIDLLNILWVFDEKK